MMNKQKQVLAVLLSCIALCSVRLAYAEPAPVFDVDSIQDNYEVENDEDLPPPPAPSGRSEVFAPQHVHSDQQDDWSDSENTGSAEQRMRRIEKQIDYLQSNTGAKRFESLQSEVQAMRGQIELLTRKLENIESSQKTLYADLDKRLSDLAKVGSSGQPVASNAKAKPSGATVKQAEKTSKQQPNVEEEQAIYQTAYTLIKEKKYNEAVDALHRMLQKYPSGQFASNAHYWLGELYGLMNQNIKAMQEFRVVVRHYPDSPRVSDAQLKIGLIYASDSKWSEAKASFKKVINRYPGTTSARLASEQLKQMRAAGH